MPKTRKGQNVKQPGQRPPQVKKIKGKLVRKTSTKGTRYK